MLSLSTLVVTLGYNMIVSLVCFCSDQKRFVEQKIIEHIRL